MPRHVPRGVVGFAMTRLVGERCSRSQRSARIDPESDSDLRPLIQSPSDGPKSRPNVGLNASR